MPAADLPTPQQRHENILGFAEWVETRKQDTHLSPQYARELCAAIRSLSSQLEEAKKELEDVRHDAAKCDALFDDVQERLDEEISRVSCLTSMYDSMHPENVPHREQPGKLIASLRSQLEEARAPAFGSMCHRCKVPVQVVQTIERSAWGSIRWSDAPVVEYVGEHSVCPQCGDEFLTLEQVNAGQSRLWKETIPALHNEITSLRSELSAARKERDEANGQIDLLLESVAKLTGIMRTIGVQQLGEAKVRELELAALSDPRALPSETEPA